MDAKNNYFLASYEVSLERIMKIIIIPHIKLLVSNMNEYVISGSSCQ
jgi:hypothetical protein